MFYHHPAMAHFFHISYVVPAHNVQISQLGLQGQLQVGISSKSSITFKNLI